MALAELDLKFKTFCKRAEELQKSSARRIWIPICKEQKIQLGVISLTRDPSKWYACYKNYIIYGDNDNEAFLDIHGGMPMCQYMVSVDGVFVAQSPMYMCDNYITVLEGYEEVVEAIYGTALLV